jgi:hypothetical protein
MEGHADVILVPGMEIRSLYVFIAGELALEFLWASTPDVEPD